MTDFECFSEKVCSIFCLTSKRENQGPYHKNVFPFEADAVTNTKEPQKTLPGWCPST